MQEKETRIAIITGASAGIGRASALKLAKRGFRLVLNARGETNLKELATYINNESNSNQAITVSGNIADIAVSELCITECFKCWQAFPSVFIASAGRGLPGTVITSELKEWEDLVQTNIIGLMNQLRVIGKGMTENQTSANPHADDRKDIIVIGSSIGRNVSPFNSVYGATKFAAHGLTEALRRELGPKGIRVSLIEPGIVKTDFQKSAGYDPEWFDKYAEEVGPLLTGEDIAGVIDYVLSLPANVNVNNISIRPTRQAYP